PQAVNRNRIAIAISEWAEGGTGDGIEGINASIAEIANQQIIAELAEIGGSQGQAPGRIERKTRNETLRQGPVGVEDIDEPIACAFYVIMMGRVLQGKGDIELVINGLDAEGSKTLGWWSCYRAIGRQRRVGEGFDELKIGIELLYL